MNLWLLGDRMGGRDSEGVWDGHVHSAIFKMDNCQGPTVPRDNTAFLDLGFLASSTVGEYLSVVLTNLP